VLIIKRTSHSILISSAAIVFYYKSWTTKSIARKTWIHYFGTFIFHEQTFRLKIWVMSHIPKFENASKSLVRDVVVSLWRCIISFRDAHLQNAGYVTLLKKIFIKENLPSFNSWKSPSRSKKKLRITAFIHHTLSCRDLSSGKHKSSWA